MLAEIHKSKATFCSYIEPEYADYDIILTQIEKINIRTIAEAKRNKAKKQGTRAYDCLLYTSPSPRDLSTSRMPSSA